MAFCYGYNYIQAYAYDMCYGYASQFNGSACVPLLPSRFISENQTVS